MLDHEDLQSAVAAGLLSPSQAQALRDHAQARRRQGGGEDEHFRLISGFNDVFVAVALVVLLAALGWLGGRLLPFVGGLAVVGAAWALSEYFVLRRRLALPAVVLALASAVGAITLVWSAAPGAWMPLRAGLAVAAVALLHGARFRVPLDAALLAGGLGGALLATGELIWKGLAQAPLSYFLLGLLVLLLAMRLDSQDPQRRTLKADAAFWLHLLAAPCLVHGLFGLMGSGDGAARALLMLACYLALAVIALVLDRRALLVSGLAYVLAALTQLFEGSVGIRGLGFAVAALVVGSALLLLAAAWTQARRPLLQRLPDRWQAALPAP